MWDDLALSHTLLSNHNALGHTVHFTDYRLLYGITRHPLIHSLPMYCTLHYAKPFTVLTTAHQQLSYDITLWIKLPFTIHTQVLVLPAWQSPARQQAATSAHQPTSADYCPFTGRRLRRDAQNSLTSCASRVNLHSSFSCNRKRNIVQRVKIWTISIIVSCKYHHNIILMRRPVENA